MAAEHAEATVVLCAEQGFADWLLLGTSAGSPIRHEYEVQRSRRAKAYLTNGG
jgi:hypothetical protein